MCRNFEFGSKMIFFYRREADRGKVIDRFSRVFIFFLFVSM